MLKIERVSSLLTDLAKNNSETISCSFLFDADGEILASSTLQPSQSMLIKTVISSWFDFSDLGAIDENDIQELKNLTFEFEVG